MGVDVGVALGRGRRVAAGSVLSGRNRLSTELVGSPSPPFEEAPPLSTAQAARIDNDTTISKIKRFMISVIGLNFTSKSNFQISNFFHMDII
jgi:hypothetical protein